VVILRRSVRIGRRLLAFIVALVASAVVGLTPAAANQRQPPVILTPTINGTVTGWLTDFADERNYMLNTYLKNLDYLAQDPDYTLALTDAPVLIALLELAPERADDVRRFHREGRLEFANAFLLSGALGVTGGEALMRMGIEGIQWTDEVFGARPRTLWLVDSTGIPNQMPQIAEQLGVRGMVFSRNNPMPVNTFKWRSPNGSVVPATVRASGTYTNLDAYFRLERRMNDRDMDTVRSIVAQHRGREAPGVPTFLPVAAGDYGLPPQAARQATRLRERWQATAPDEPLKFGTPAEYFEAVAASGAPLPEFSGEVPYGYGAFWVNIPRVKQQFRATEHKLFAAEAISSVASLTGGADYPSETLTYGWLNLLMNMDRSALWSVGAGVVFEHPTIWDVADRFVSATAGADQAIQQAMRVLAPATGPAGENSVTLVNPLNWARSDAVVLRTPGGRGLDGITCEALDAPDEILCTPELPSFGAATFGLRERPVAQAPIASDGVFETVHYRLQIDKTTGDLSSLKLKADGRELLGGPANAIISETQTESGVDVLAPRVERRLGGRSADTTVSWEVFQGAVSTAVVTVQPLSSGGSVRRVVRLYPEQPRIDFETTLTDIPDLQLISASFPLAQPITGTPRGAPYGFAESSSSGSVIPAVRWSGYELADGGSFAILDRGVPGREVAGNTVTLPLLNAQNLYRGFPNPSSSGNGSHRFQYSLMATPGGWREAKVAWRAWEFNAPLLVEQGVLPQAGPVSWLSTSENVIVESIRRVGGELEIRLVEGTGRGGPGRVEVRLPHEAAYRTSPLGEGRAPLAGAGVYALQLAPQEIVTLRLAVNAAPAPTVPALRTFRPLVPPQKQPSLEIRHNLAGHPPEEYRP